MPNDQEWQRRTDEWVRATHASRVRKEKELAEKYKDEPAKREKQNQRVKPIKQKKKK